MSNPHMEDTMDRTQFTVIYRTGGWRNAEWHMCSYSMNAYDARKRADELNRMGYKTIQHYTDQLEKMGLPVGFCRHADPITGEMKAKTCDCT